MNAAFDKVFARYADRAKAESAEQEREGLEKVQARIDDFLLPIGEEAARLLHALIVAREAKVIVELGGSYGFSTLFLADAARATGGTVYSFELSDKKVAYAQKELGEAGLAKHVDWRLGDAVALLEEFDQAIDFVLIDLWKDLYVPCLERVYPKLNDNAIIAADNMLFPESYRDKAATYRAAVAAKPDLQTVLLPVGLGIELSCLWREDPTARA